MATKTAVIHGQNHSARRDSIISIVSVGGERKKMHYARCFLQTCFISGKIVDAFEGLQATAGGLPGFGWVIPCASSYSRRLASNMSIPSKKSSNLAMLTQVCDDFFPSPHCSDRKSTGAGALALAASSHHLF